MTAFWYYHQGSVGFICADGVSLGASLVVTGASLVVAGTSLVVAGASLGASVGAAVVAGSW